jgi:hypothetical protein
MTRHHDYDYIQLVLAHTKGKNRRLRGITIGTRGKTTGRGYYIFCYPIRKQDFGSSARQVLSCAGIENIRHVQVVYQMSKHRQKDKAW